MPLKRGTQIIYVPQHASGDIHHRDCETGFVTSVRGRSAFCRYWSRTPPFDLRTKSHSELTPLDAIVVRATVPQARVEAALEKYCREERPAISPPYFHWDTDFLARFWDS